MRLRGERTCRLGALALSLGAYLLSVISGQKVVLQWPGRTFSGQKGDYADLLKIRPSWGQVKFGGAMSISFWANWHGIVNHGAIMNFDNGELVDNIIVANSWTQPDLIFKVRQGTAAPFHTQSYNVIRAGERVRHLITVNTTGEVKIYEGTSLSTYKVIKQQTNAKLIPPFKKRSRMFVGRGPSEAEGYFHGAIETFAILDEPVDWPKMWELVTTTTSTTTVSAGPGIQVLVTVETSKQPGAETNSGATIALKVGNRWTAEETLCTGAIQGQIIEKTYQSVQIWPTDLRITATGNDAWGLRKVTVAVVDPTPGCVGCPYLSPEAHVLRPVADMSYSSTSKHWIHGDPVAPTVLRAQVYSIQDLMCTAHTGIGNAATPSCKEGSTMVHGRQCTTVCVTGYHPSPTTLQCTYGVLEPASFQCIENSCRPPTIPLYGESGTCNAGADMIGGASCQINCLKGYEPSGVTRCSKGNVINAVCNPKPCDITHNISINAERGTCPPKFLHSGHSCQMKCPAGYHSGRLECSLGNLTVIDCAVTIAVDVETSTVEFAGTTDGASLRFRYGQRIWSEDRQLATAATRREIINRTYTLAEWPTYIKLVALGTDAWGIKDIYVSVVDPEKKARRLQERTTGLASVRVALPTLGQQHALLKVWMGTDKDAFQQHDWPIPQLTCAVPSVIHAANPTCIGQAMVIPYQSTCHIQCVEGYVPSIDTLYCELGGIIPATFECLPAPCNASVAPEHGDVGDCHEALPSGSTCSNTCEDGYDVSGSVSCSLGKLTPAICRPRKCDAVIAPANGTIGDCESSLASGESCTPTCDEGYILAYRTTCYTGTLNLGECAPNTCTMETPLNGVSGPHCPDSIKHGASCLPVCNEGYVLKGETTCQYGTLKVAECAPMDCVSSANGLAPYHGKAGDCKQVMASGTLCNPVCDPGYVQVGNTTCSLGKLSLARCMVDFVLHIHISQLDYSESAYGATAAFDIPGTGWSQDIVLADRASKGENISKTYHWTDWPTRLRLTPLHLDAWGIKQIVIAISGISVVVLDSSGEGPFTADSKHWLQRTPDGGGKRVYQIPLPVCPVPQGVPRTSVTCPFAGTGSVQVIRAVTSMTHGRECDVACSKGYEPQDKKVFCSLGVFHPKEFPCVPIHCPMPTFVANGQLGTCPSILPAGRSCEYKCDDGFRLTSTISCVLGVATNAQCVPADCRGVHAPLNGNIGNCPSTLKPGESCRPVCHSGYFLEEETVCGEGNFTLGVCTGNPCDSLPIPKFGSAGTCGSSLRSGESCQPECKNGYHANGTTSCYLGKVMPGICILNSCPLPAIVENGNRGSCPMVLAGGATCSFDCDTGYAPNATTACLHNLTIGYCTPKSCEMSQYSPVNGKHVSCPMTLASGKTCNATCDDGYFLNGTGKTLCFLGGVELAQCSPKFCEITSPPWHGGVGDCPAILYAGEQCQPTCKAGYVPSGKASCRLGKLDFSCVPTTCNSSIPPKNGGRGNCTDRLDHGRSCQPTCKPGYNVSGPSNCSLGKFQSATCIPDGCEIRLLPANSAGRGDCPDVLPKGWSCRPVCQDGYSASTFYCDGGILQRSQCTLQSARRVAPTSAPETTDTEKATPYLLAGGSIGLFIVLLASVYFCMRTSSKAAEPKTIVYDDDLKKVAVVTEPPAGSNPEVLRLTKLVDELQERQDQRLRDPRDFGLRSYPYDPYSTPSRIIVHEPAVGEELTPQRPVNHFSSNNCISADGIHLQVNPNYRETPSTRWTPGTFSQFTPYSQGDSLLSSPRLTSSPRATYSRVSYQRDQGDGSYLSRGRNIQYFDDRPAGRPQTRGRGPVFSSGGVPLPSPRSHSPSPSRAGNETPSPVPSPRDA